MSCSTSALDGTGQIVPVEDPAALAEAVDALLADPNWRRQLGLAAASGLSRNILFSARSRG